MATRLRAPVVAPANDMIDLNTKVTIRAASEQVDIYYTINGQAPNPFQTIGEKFTIKYTKPFTLPLGKRTLKALCISKVHKTADASPMVTKFYQVVERLTPDLSNGDELADDAGADQRGGDIVPPDQARHIAREMTAAMMQGTLRETDVFHQWRANADVPPSDAPPKLHQYCSVCNARRSRDAAACSVCGTQFPDALRTKKEHVPASNGHSPHPQLRDSTGSPHHGHHHHHESLGGRATHNHRDSTLLADQRPAADHMLIPTIKCPFCTAALRPDARFCLTCQNKLPDSVSAWSAARGDTAKKFVECRSCGVRNATTLTHCTHCEAKLIVSAPHPEGQHPCACRSCGRLNTHDARFCTWCGFKMPLQTQQLRVCAICNLENALGARYCNDCGTLLGPDIGVADATRRKTNRPYFAEPSNGPPRAADAAAQTDAALDPAITGSTLRQEKKSTSSNGGAGADRAVPFQPGMVSIGKGYWRQQIEHIAASLKHFTRESAPFQAALGQPLMSDVLRARVDEEGDEVVVTLVLRRVPPPKQTESLTSATMFAPATSLVRDGSMRESTTSIRDSRHGSLREEERVSDRGGTRGGFERTRSSTSSAATATATGALAATTQRRLAGRAEEDDGWHLSARDAKSDAQGKRLPAGGDTTRRGLAPTSTLRPGSTEGTTHGGLSSKDAGREGGRERDGTRDRDDLSGAGSMRGQPSKHSQQLMMELGELGEGREDVVLGLLDSGADANTSRPDKQRALHLAARRGFHKCIQLLIDGNADLNACDRKGDTALHAAVIAPVHAQDCIDILLRAGADVTVKNNDGLTPAALAVASGQRQLAVLFGAHLSRSVVDSFAHSKQPRA